MISSRDVQKIVHSYVKHTGNPRGSWESFEQFSFRYARRFVEQHPEVQELLGEGRRSVLTTALGDLERKGSVQLERSEAGDIEALYYPGFYTTEIGRWYRRMGEERDLPFPSEEQLSITVPAGLLRTVEVENDLMHWLTEEDEDPSQVLLIHFPNNTNDVLTTVHLLRDAMVPIVLNKIRDYLRTDKNAGYSETKLRTIFRTREMLVHDLIETAQTRPEEALKSIRQPNEFSFHFWTQLSSMVIKDYSQKSEKLEMEHGFMQAAYFLGYYSVYFKGRHQKERELEQHRKLLNDGFQASPWAFTVQDVYNFKDDKGITLQKKSSREDINGWLEEMLKRPGETTISELVSINTAEKNGVMIHSKQYIPLLLRQIKAAAPVLERELTNEMVSILFDEQDEPWLRDDAAFEEMLTKKVRTEFPLLSALASFQTIFLVVDGQELPSGLREAAMNMIDRQAKEMRRWAEILQLDRTRILRDARLRLPAWMLIPILRGIIRIFRRMFANEAQRRVGRSRAAARSQRESQSAATTAPTSGEPSRETARKEFQAKLSKMQEAYLTSGQTPDQRLKELRKQWNPLIDPVAHENLVEDVNSLCRDALRRARYAKTLRAPDPAAIEEMARTIAGNSAFERIRRRRQFENYLKLYMLTALQRS